MHLNCEYLPATAEARQELVLLHGWGSVPAIWRTLLAGLRPHANIRLLDVPGCVPGGARLEVGGEAALEVVMESVLASSPPRAVFMGWSLGGNLAIALAGRHPDRVAAVITLATNPSFIQREDWAGMPGPELGEFRRAFSEQPTATLRRFDALQVAGSPAPKARMRQLRELGRAPADASQQVGLEWLEMLDQRELVASLTLPQLHLLADCDELVPASVAPAMENLLVDCPAADVQVLAGAGHLLMLDAPEAVVDAVTSFFGENNLWQPVCDAGDSPNKRDIAESFSRAAPVYDSVARLQRDVGDRLMSQLDHLESEPELILDLGCGTGHFQGELQRRFPDAEYVGLDIASGMVEFARSQRTGAGHWLVGDAESLPLAAGSVDLVFSSLAIQWCYRPQQLFAELRRVLKPGGKCVFTTLGPATLHELRAAWAAVDDHQHVNRFLAPEELSEAARSVPDISLALDTAVFRMHYQRVRDLLAELKTLGAHNMNRDRPAGLTPRGALQGMLKAYEEWREGNLLPATYDVILGTLER